MKNITEFPSFVLTKAISAKAALVSEGKSSEEIEQSMGTTFKFEGDKLKHFLAALDVAGQNPQNLRRVLVVSLNEGETAPAKATKVEETYYVPEFLVTSAPKAEASASRGGRGGGGRPKGGKSGPKSSPWGLSPEEQAAKNKGPASR